MQHGLANICSVFLSLLRQDHRLRACTLSLICPATHTDCCQPAHPALHSHTRLWHQRHIYCKSDQKSKMARKWFLLGLKNILKNISSSFPLVHLVKDGLQYQQAPAVPNSPLSTYAAPRDPCHVRAKTLLKLSSPSLDPGRGETSSNASWGA